MKTAIKITGFLFLIITLAFYSCKKKTTATPPTATPTPTASSSLIGTWKWVKLYALPNGSVTPTDGDSISKPSGKQIIFASDSTYTATWSFAQMGTPPATNPDNGMITKPDSLYIISLVSGYQARGKIIKLTSTEFWYRYKIYNGTIYEVHFIK